MEQSKEQLVEQIADNPERFGMARLHLFNQLIDLRPKERELREKLETAKDDKQKAFFQKALTNVQGWIEEFAAAYELLGEKPAAIVEAMGVQDEEKVEQDAERKYILYGNERYVRESYVLEEFTPKYLLMLLEKGRIKLCEGNKEYFSSFDGKPFNLLEKFIPENQAPAKAVESMPENSPLENQVIQLLEVTRQKNVLDAVMYVVGLQEQISVLEEMYAEIKMTCDKTLIAEYVGSFGDTLSSEDKNDLCKNIVGYFESFHKRTGTYKLPLHESKPVEAMDSLPAKKDNSISNNLKP
jgi:hypothetical protein